MRTAAPNYQPHESSMMMSTLPKLYRLEMVFYIIQNMYNLESSSVKRDQLFNFELINRATSFFANLYDHCRHQANDFIT